MENSYPYTLESPFQTGQFSIVATTQHSRETCRPTFHRYFSLEPQALEDGSQILIISVCSNCGDVLEYRTSIKD